MLRTVAQLHTYYNISKSCIQRRASNLGIQKTRGVYLFTEQEVNRIIGLTPERTETIIVEYWIVESKMNY